MFLLSRVRCQTVNPTVTVNLAAVNVSGVPAVARECCCRRPCYCRHPYSCRSTKELFNGTLVYVLWKRSTQNGLVIFSAVDWHRKIIGTFRHNWFLSIVADPQHFNTAPDPTFHSDADPDRILPLTFLEIWTLHCSKTTLLGFNLFTFMRIRIRKIVSQSIVSFLQCLLFVVC
jgi:hypothetical protein